MRPEKALPQKLALSFLRLSSIALTALYVYNIQNLARLKQQQKNGGLGVLHHSLQSPSSKISSTLLTYPRHCYLSDLLYYYVAASLIWNTILFWRKRSKRNHLLIFIALVAGKYTVDKINGGYHKTSSTLDENDRMKHKGGGNIAARNCGDVYSDSYSPNHHLDSAVRISFRLHNLSDVPCPDKFLGIPGYMCRDEILPDLPPSLSKLTILNFTTTISTDLKIVFVGDSISEQFAAAFDAAVLGEGYEANRLARTYRNGKEDENIHNCLSVSAPIRGGGVSAFWRIVTLMTMSTRTDYYLCEHKWKNWNEGQALKLVDHRYLDPERNKLGHQLLRPINEPNVNIEARALREDFYSVSSFDAAIMRIPHGWLKIEQITKEKIIEAITLTNKNLGAQTVTIPTQPFNNHVMTLSDWQGIARINQMIRDIARDWVPSAPGSVDWILVQEFGNFTNQVFFSNAKHIGLYNQPGPDFSQEGWELKGGEFLFHRLSAERYWNPSVSMVCAGKTYTRTNENQEMVEDCVRNKISRDGQHLCIESLGSRYSASIACLLGCIYNGRQPSASAQDIKSVKKCERQCNDQFMSIYPVKPEWITSSMSLYSNAV